MYLPHSDPVMFSIGNLKCDIYCLVKTMLQATTSTTTTTTKTRLEFFSTMTLYTWENSEICFPYRIFTLATSLMHFTHSLRWLTNAAATPVKWRATYIPCLCLPFTIWKHYVYKAAIVNVCIRIFHYTGMCDWILPGGVPQHRLLSSICSTSRPMNHDPNDTSSFANRWSICLNISTIKILVFMF